jgi:hypothetical protein
VSSRKEQKERARAERLAREAKQAEEARRRRRLQVGGSAVGLVVALIAIVLVLNSQTSSKAINNPSTPVLKLASLSLAGKLSPPPPAGSLGPEGVPVPAAANLAASGTGNGGGSVDGIQCLGSEQLLFHIHAHLAIFVNGVARKVPSAIGITNGQVQNTPQGQFAANGNCFYWLHTHGADGIIHIESPQQRTFTLGNFFDIWGQKLSAQQVGPAIGPVTAIYNNQLYQGNPRNIPLTAHAQIQLDVGTPRVAPQSVTFAGTL